MIKEFEIVVKPADAGDNEKIRSLILKSAKDFSSRMTGYYISKRSIDARSKNPVYRFKVMVFVDEPVTTPVSSPRYKDANSNTKVIIVGAGPAGLFAALRLLENGVKPVILERGKDVQARRRDLRAIMQFHEVNPDSNYCFGEGGAGTYSDGKLYTRSDKRGNVLKILNILVMHGADPDILVDAHPHIGSNKLPKIIASMRQTILDNGGEIHFASRVTGILRNNDKITGVIVNESEEFLGDAVILATGHSARDVFYLLDREKILMEAKPFALGVRIEHPQALIDEARYHSKVRDPNLPAASYTLTCQASGRGVYSFCMCPGGIIAPCATDKEEVVTNGWSPSKRNNPYANSGIVVGLNLNDYKKHEKLGALSGLAFQQEIEKQAWVLGGKTQTAPAQALADFINNKFSTQLPNCSYQPGIKSTNMFDVLGKNIAFNLQVAFKNFGSKIKNFITNDALIVGVESRTSTPVRIPRDKETLQHLQISNLYPCAEGAGYAGGIMSAAMDGEKCVEAILKNNF